MDLNNTYWNQQQNQTFPVPIIPNTNTTIFYPTATAITENNTAGITVQYNPQLFSNIQNQSSINLNSTNQLQQVRIIQQNLPSTSSFHQQQQNYDTDNSSALTKIESQFPNDHNLQLKPSKNSTKSAVRSIKKVSNELDFLQNENFDELHQPSDLLIEELDENGQTYTTISGEPQRHKQVKKLGPTCRQEYCRKSKFRFCSNFTKETRQRIFDEFWYKLNWDQRHIYVATRVFRKSIIRRQSEKEGGSRRTYTLVYTLRNSNGNSEQVCRDMFLNTLSISDKQVTIWVKKYSFGGDGVSQTKQLMFKPIESVNKKLDEENGTLGVIKKPTIQPIAEKSDDLNITKKPKRIRNRKRDPNKPTRTRNLVPNPEAWKRNIIKRLRLEGKAYKSGLRGKLNEGNELIERKAKQLLPTCDSPQCNNSRLRHCSTISEWRREQIFNDIWNKWDWNQRKIFVASMVSRKDTKRKRLRTSLTSRRQATLIYNLPNDHGIPVQICQKMFVNTTAVSKSQVLRWIKQYSLGSKIEEDLISYKDATTHASEWLDGLPKIKSIVNGEIIYYLDPQYKNFSDFYNTYCDIYNKEQESNGIVMKKYVFTNMCRIKKIFLMPQNNSDENNCIICKEHSKNINNSTNNDDIWIQHKLKKENAKMEKLQDQKLAKTNRAIVLLVHLQPIKCVPILKDTVTLHKSKLNCYNFTIHNLKTQFSQCYWFSEDQCGELINNNSPESVFTSIIYDYIKQNCLEMKLPIIIYSDGQLEQTRNVILSNALLNLSLLNGIEILQKFSEPGHSLVDDCFKVNSIFDKYIYIKKKEIYLPSQLAKATREIKRSPKLFHGIHLDYEHFYDFSKSEYYHYNSINPGGDGGGNNGLVESLNEKDICAMKYTNNGKILIKFYFDDEWIELSQKLNNNVKPILEYTKLYAAMPEISKTKWDDLQDLKLLIPFDCQPFYDSIKYFED